MHLDEARNLRDTYRFKPSPDSTGWYISMTEQINISEDISINRVASILQRTEYLGPYHDKVSAVTELKDMIKGHLSYDKLDYKVEYYIVHISVDKNAGSWSPKMEDYKNE